MKMLMRFYVWITYVTEQNGNKSTFSMDLLNAIRLEKSTTLRGNAFDMLTTRSAKNSDLVVQLVRRFEDFVRMTSRTWGLSQFKKFIRAQVYETKYNFIAPDQIYSQTSEFKAR